MNFGAARAAPVAIKDYSDDFFVEPAGTSNQQQPQQETDARRLQQRQKQIDYGKNTLAYQRYVKAVPRYNRRILHGVVPIDPITPDIRQNISKRCFDGQVKKWRRMLHTWDEKADEADEAVQLVPGGSNPAPPGGRAGASKQPVPEVQPMPMGQRAPSRDNRQQPMGEGQAYSANQRPPPQPYNAGSSYAKAPLGGSNKQPPPHGYENPYSKPAGGPAAAANGGYPAGASGSYQAGGSSYHSAPAAPGHRPAAPPRPQQAQHAAPASMAAIGVSGLQTTPDKQRGLPAGGTVSSGTKRSFAETLKDLPLDVQDDSKRYRRMSNEPAAEGFSPAPAAQPAGGIAAEGPMAAADALTAVEEPAPAAAAEAGATIYDDWEEEDVGL